MSSASRCWLGVALLSFAWAGACSRDIPLGSDELPRSPSESGGASGSGGVGGRSGFNGGTGGGAGEGAAAGDAGSSGSSTCERVACRGKYYACGNCKDDDEDGSIDAEDAHCTGPCDDLEDSFDVGLPGSSGQACQVDCFFDRGSGSGNDGCRFSTRCDPLAVAPDYPPTGSASCAYDESSSLPGGSGSCAELRVDQPASCAEICGPLTPNGCDCFGCCELPARSGRYQSLATGLACSPVEGCLNRCEDCERCVGLAGPLASCTGDPADSCDTILRPCDFSGGQLCSGHSYCITGCCVPEPR